jgi:hypothetical protein
MSPERQQTVTCIFDSTAELRLALLREHQQNPKAKAYSPPSPEGVSKLETAALRPRRPKPAPRWDEQVVGVGFSRGVRESAGSMSFETPPAKAGE